MEPCPSMDGLEILATELVTAQQEIEGLKDQLFQRDCALRDKEGTLSCRVVKADGSRISDQIEELKLKTVENSELWVQVGELRKHLNDSIVRTEELDTQLCRSSATIERLSSEKESDQKMILDLCYFVRRIADIDLNDDDEKHVSKQLAQEELLSPDSLAKLKKKVTDLEKDRQLRIIENEELVKTVRSLSYELDDARQEASRIESTKSATSGQEQQERNHKSAMKEPLDSRPLNESAESAVPSTDTTWKAENSPSDIELENISHPVDGREVLFTSSIYQNLSNLTEDNFMNKMFADARAAVKKSNTNLDDATAKQLVLLREQHSRLQEEYDASKNIVSQMEEAMDMLEKQRTNARKKQSLREQMLRDVIKQYKELQLTHQECLSKLDDLEKAHEEHATHKLQEAPPPMMVSSDSSSTESMTSTRSSSSRACVPPATSTDEYQKLQADYRRLEDDYQMANQYIENLEQSQKDALEDQEHLQDYNETRRAHQDVAEKLRICKAELVAATRKHEADAQELNESLLLCEEFSEENTETLQKFERVQAELTESTAREASLQQELILALRKMTRPDLYIRCQKLEKEWKYSKEELVAKEQLLDAAKKDLAKNKEDVRSIRKRMTGCSCRYRALQQSYDDVTLERHATENALEQAKKQVELLLRREKLSKEKETYATQMTNQARKEKCRLEKANEQLKEHVEDLLVLASRSVIGVDY